MSLKSAPYWWVACDCCGEDAAYGDFAAWKDASTALDLLDNAYFQEIDGEHLCDACWEWPDDEADTDDPVRKHAVHPEPETAEAIRARRESQGSVA